MKKLATALGVVIAITAATFAQQVGTVPRAEALKVYTWLDEEIYPGLVGHRLDPEGVATWLMERLPIHWYGQPSGTPADVRTENAKHRLFEDIFFTIYPRPAPPQPEFRQIRGQLRVRGTAYADENGDIAPTLAHFGEAFSRYVRDPDLVRRQLDYVAAVGYHGIRFWDVLGYYDGAWSGREVTPIGFENRSGGWVSATPNYYGQLEAFLRELQARGLVAHHSRGDQNAWSREQKREHIRQVAEVIARVGPQTIALFEVSNESWQNGVEDPAEAADLLRIFKARHPQVLGALSCPPGASEEAADIREWSRDPADVIAIHGDRGPFPNNVRHIFSLHYEGRPHFGASIEKPIWQGEPTGPGPGVTVGREESPEVLALLAAMASMTGQEWTYMSSNGVFFNGPLFAPVDTPTRRTFKASATQTTTWFAPQWNFDQHQPGFVEAARVRSLLPDDVGQYGIAVHGGRGEAVFTSPTGFLHEGRIDQVISFSRNKVAAIAYGGDGEIQAKRHVRGKVCDPVPNRDGCYDFELGPGQRMKLRYEFGRVITADIVN